MSLRSSAFSPKPLGVPDPRAGFGVVIQERVAQSVASPPIVTVAQPVVAPQQQQRQAPPQAQQLQQPQPQQPVVEVAHEVEDDDGEESGDSHEIIIEEGPDNEEEVSEDTVEEHPMSVTITTDRQAVECGRDVPLTGLITLKASEDYPMPRGDVDVVVVLGRSSDAETHANMLHSLEFLVGQLAPNDRMALITYDEEAELVLPLGFLSQSRVKHAETLAVIEGIPLGTGSSNLAAGLTQGLALVEADPDRLSCYSVVLISDAQPTGEFTSAEAIIKECGLANAEARRQLRISQRLPQHQDHPYIVYTVGYGGAHDADVLQAISEVAKGVYYYVPQRDLIANAVADIQGGLASAVAVRIEVAVRPALGVEVTSIDTQYKCTEYDNGFVIDVGDIHKGEETNIVVDMTCLQLDGEPVGCEQQLVDIHVKYLDMRYHDAGIAQTRLYTSIDVLRPMVAPPQERSRLVEIQEHRIRAVKALRQALANSQNNKGRKEASKALRKISQHIAVSDVADWSHMKALVADLDAVAQRLRSDRTEEWRNILITAVSRHSFERSTGHPMADHYATTSRAASLLHVGRSLKQAMSRLLQSARFSDLQIGGHHVHKAIIGIRAPLLLTAELSEAEVEHGLRTVLFYIYTDDYEPPRRGAKALILDVRFTVLALAKKLHLERLESLVREELKKYAFVDVSVLTRALEVGENDIVDAFVHKFVYQPDHRTEQLQNNLGSVPQVLPQIFREFREAAMDEPEPEEPLDSSLASDVATLLASGDHADLQLRVVYNGRRAEFSVHKAILYSRCPWFEFQEGTVIESPIPHKAFRALLKFLYSDVPPRNVLDCLWVVAHFSRAGVASMEVAKEAIARISESNCYAAYDLSSRLNMPSFKEAALDVIETEFQDTSRLYVVRTQQQLDELRASHKELQERVLALENADDESSDDGDDDRD